MRTKKRTQEVVDALIAGLAETANVSEAARRVGISRDLAYDWRKKSEDGELPEPCDTSEGRPLHEAWKSALHEAADGLEMVAHNLATGYQEVVVHQGQIMRELDPETMELVPVTITKYDTRMLEILLKARRPERFREKHDVRHSGKVEGALILPTTSPVDIDEWNAAVAKHQAKGRGEEPKE